MAKTRVDIGSSKIAPPIFDDFLNDQDFFKDIDNAFTRIQMSKGKTKPVNHKMKAKNKAVVKDELKEMQKTFKSMIQLHLSPVVRYLKAVDLGVTSKDLTEIVEYIVGPLILKSKKVGLLDETKALIQFQRDLKKINRATATKLTGANATDLTTSFDAVIKHYGLEFRGHSTAVVNVVGFYKVIKKKQKFTESDLRKLFAIGIPSLSMLRKISLQELSSLTGLAIERCAELRLQSRKFNLYSLVN